MEKFRNYFNTERFQLPELNAEQQKRAKLILDLNKVGLPKQAFGYVPLSLEILQNFLFKGKLEGFPGNPTLEVPKLKPQEEVIQYYPATDYAEPDYLDLYPNYNPKKKAEIEAEIMAQIHFVMTKLGLPIKNKHYFNMIDALIFDDLHIKKDTLKAKNFLKKTYSATFINSSLEEAKQYRGMVLALGRDVETQPAFEVARLWDPEDDAIISDHGIPEKFLIGLKTQGLEEEFLLSLNRKLKSQS